MKIRAVLYGRCNAGVCICTLTLYHAAVAWICVVYTAKIIKKCASVHQYMNLSELGGCNHSFKHHWSISHLTFLGGQVKRVPGSLLADECLQLSYNPPAWVLVSKFWFSPWVFCCWTEFMFLMCCSINCFIQDLQKKNRAEEGIVKPKALSDQRGAVVYGEAVLLFSSK